LCRKARIDRKLDANNSQFHNVLQRVKIDDVAVAEVSGRMVSARPSQRVVTRLKSNSLRSARGASTVIYPALPVSFRCNQTRSRQRGPAAQATSPSGSTRSRSGTRQKARTIMAPFFS
jgi:hypothetical protein